MSEELENMLYLEIELMTAEEVDSLRKEVIDLLVEASVHRRFDQ